MTRTGLVALLLALSGCASVAFRKAEGRDSIDGWHAFLASHPESSAEIDHAHERLEALSWQATLAENSPRAYRRFLDDFPDSDHAGEAQGRLTALRYQRAERGAAGGLTVFLEDEPDGPLAQSARKKLADAEFAAAAKAHGVSPVQLYLARFPDGPHLEEARALLDDRAYEAAVAGGALGLDDYVAAHPDGKHRGEAEARLFEGRISALIAEERFDEAAAGLKAAGALPGKERLAAQLAAARKQAALAAATAVAGVSRAEREALQADAFALAPPDRAAVAQLAAGLEDVDPASRWRTAAALGATGSVWALDPLLAAASASHFWKVRSVAARAVLELVSGWPDAVKQQEVARRVLALRPLVAGAELSDRVGLLEEAAGDVAAAREAFAQSRRYLSSDLLAVERGMRLAREAGDMPAHLALAHDLVEGAARWADDRLRDEGLPPLLADRQLCGLTDLAREGASELTADGAEAAAWLPAARARSQRLGELLTEEERLAAVDDPAFAGCAAEPPDPAAAAVKRRLAAVAAVASRLGSVAEAEVARALLEETATRDASKEVRAAAALALRR